MLVLNKYTWIGTKKNQLIICYTLLHILFFIGVSVDLNRYSLLYEVRRNHLWVLEFKWIVFARGLEEVFKTNIVQHKSVKFVGRIIN